MSASNTNLVTIFNDHFIEFLTDIHNVFPEDTDILTAKNASGIVVGFQVELPSDLEQIIKFEKVID
jgi:hypothetical protein